MAPAEVSTQSCGRKCYGGGDRKACIVFVTTCGCVCCVARLSVCMCLRVRGTRPPWGLVLFWVPAPLSGRATLSVHSVCRGRRDSRPREACPRVCNLLCVC